MARKLESLNLLHPGANNLDCLTTDPQTLMGVWADSRKGWALARYLFPSRPAHYVRTTYDLGHYAANKATAMGCRLRGDVRAAEVYESICEAIYKRLPDYARW